MLLIHLSNIKIKRKYPNFLSLRTFFLHYLAKKRNLIVYVGKHNQTE